MSIGSEIADRAVSLCDHIPVRHRPHDWACAVCVAKQADAALAEKEGEIAQARAIFYEKWSASPDEKLPDMMRMMVEGLEAEHERFKARGGELDAKEGEIAGLRKDVLLDAIERNQELLSIIERFLDDCTDSPELLVNVRALMGMNATALRNGGRIQ